MAAEISRGNETIGIRSAMRRNGGRGRNERRSRPHREEGEAARNGAQRVEDRPSLPRLSASSSRQPAVSSRDARARSYVYRVDELARIIIFPRNVQLRACIAAPSPFCASHMGKIGRERDERSERYSSTTEKSATAELYISISEAS